MFNYIKDKIKLPCCGREVGGWQTKFAYTKARSGAEICFNNLMREYEVGDIDLGEVHNWCEKCQRGVEYKVKNGKVNYKSVEIVKPKKLFSDSIKRTTEM